VCPHAGGVGLCEYVIHLRFVQRYPHCVQTDEIPQSLIDYIAVSGSIDRNVLEFVDHLHEHFVYPCSINSKGRYNVPSDPDEGYRFVYSLALKVSQTSYFTATASKCTNPVYQRMSGLVGLTGKARKPGKPMVWINDLIPREDSTIRCPMLHTYTPQGIHYVTKHRWVCVPSIRALYGIWACMPIYFEGSSATIYREQARRESSARLSI
jgi:hypothetical protein